MKEEKVKKKSAKPAIIGIAAAVLVLAVIAGVLLWQMHRAKEESQFILPPMVYVENARYLYERDITADVTENMRTGFAYLGEITSTVDATEYVTENFQANSAVQGAVVYRFGLYVVLCHEEVYTLYRPMDAVQTFAYTTTAE